MEIDPQGWAQLTLSQVHNRNALTIALRQQLHGIVQSLEANPQVHVLILAADGPVFTAGLDLSEWEATSEPAAAAFVHDPVAALRQFTGPIIAAVQGAVPLLAWGLLLGNLFWVLAYDTEYAMVDRDDDLKIGMKTSAITLGDKDVPAIMGFYVAYLVIWAWLLNAAEQGMGFWLAWGVSAGQVVWHYFLIRQRSREGCFKAFRLNHWLGFSVFVGVVLSYL